MTLCRLKRRIPIVLGGIVGAVALAAVPAYGLGEAPSGSLLPGSVASALASAPVVALLVLLWQIIRAREEPRAALKTSSAGSKFLASANHEIRTPLNGVVGIAELVPGAATQLPVAGSLLAAVPPCGRRVLIVEDNPINQIVALRALTGLGYQAELAPGGEEALAAFARGRFDVILMDCQMPGMDGYQVAAEMRRVEALAAAAKPTPIIAMTANAIEGDQQKCVAAGMDDYLSKPMRLPSLARALERWTATAAQA
jgi:CheY-like chemotaxis protein